MKGSIGISLVFDDRYAVWRDVPAVPRIGETLVYDGDWYCVDDVRWYATETTWAATIVLHRIPNGEKRS